MTIEEIFSKMIGRMCEGVKFHDELMQIYDYLGLYGLAKCHAYHVFEEKRGLTNLTHYYVTHYFKLLQLENIPEPKLIPENWYKYTTQAVDTGTKRQAVKEFMEKWVTWEEDSKKIYQEMRQELYNIGEIAVAICMDKYICDVDKELCHAQKSVIKLDTIGYDIGTIIKWQEDLYTKYKKKLGW